MKIGQTPDIPVALTSTGTQVTGQGSAAPPVKKTSNSTTGTSVSVSSLAQTLGSGSTDGDIDMDKVNAVRSAIDNGTYKVNAGAIADKLLSNAQEVLQRGASQ